MSDDVEKWYYPRRLIVLLEHIDYLMDPPRPYLEDIDGMVEYRIRVEMAIYRYLENKGYRFTARLLSKYPWMYYTAATMIDEEVLVDMLRCLDDRLVFRDRRIDDIRCGEHTSLIVFE